MAQLIDMRSIPAFAAVNETVKLTSNPGERAFVNGVLRTASRNLDALPYPDEKKNYRRYLSVKHSFPLPTVKLFDTLFGREDTERLLDFYNSARYTDLTVNTIRITPEKTIAKLAECGVEISEKLDTGASLRINRSINPEKLPGFSTGDFFVQDRASHIAVAALAPTAGDTLIDTCACPGGKSFLAAIMMGNVGRVISLDLHESKLSLIEDGAERLGLDIVEAGQCDATAPRSELFGTADKVICDVPCSGLGVLAKKPDLRYKDTDSIDALPALQLDILRASSQYLRSGGEMIYSTCTLNPAENADVVNAFLAENADFTTVDFTVSGYSSVGGMLTLLPHVHHTDGFFIAKLRKTT
jgi:16S rRNA (cytosine967-C5)-methyltransferase